MGCLHRAKASRMRCFSGSGRSRRYTTGEARDGSDLQTHNNSSALTMPRATAASSSPSATAAASTLPFCTAINAGVVAAGEDGAQVGVRVEPGAQHRGLREQVSRRGTRVDEGEGSALQIGQRANIVVLARDDQRAIGRALLLVSGMANGSTSASRPPGRRRRGRAGRGRAFLRAGLLSRRCSRWPRTA